MIRTLNEGDSVIGLAMIGNRCYVIRSPTNQQIEAYDGKDFHLLGRIKVPSLGDFTWGTAACNVNRCVYVSNWGTCNAVHRIDLTENAVEDDGSELESTKWDVEMVPAGLSVNKANNVLVAFWNDANVVHEYTPRGSLKRTIRLPIDVAHPWHVVQLNTGQLLVSHGGRDAKHRVLLVKSNGQVECSYGDEQGVSEGRLSEPRQLAVSKDNIFVADCDNNRIVVLDTMLVRQHYVNVGGGGLRRPCALFLDSTSSRLLVGEVSGRVLILDLGTS